MNLSEINLSELDINEIGVWPWPAKAAVIIVVFALVVAAGWYFDWQNLQEELEEVQAQEQQLRTEFETKQRRAAALDDYKEQLAEMEESFGAMLRQLPSRVEVAGLLVDISQTGLSAGLEFELFRPQQTQEQEFYAEMPIDIEVRGGYHQFGRFVSGVANLPRIVTLHDVSISRTEDGGGLAMQATARTYWYLDEGGE
ncbi:type 4a pilus biogenesis protein PilO [Aquisalimonas lutea]|uniref:type 4a pilus biogenesis protein PilO n=1 Tax=Aquisalimonas lutea TaxID=1327750 RepID=UPI0025B520BC|nr:type 4a pilus biogenesis protein PilO [Aquisalimonas lutea]MDN3516898.1 type 4a pilus biogenesis protein PilO [Aquisalimonas lutea]